jgi:hypothetical protein
MAITANFADSLIVEPGLYRYAGFWRWSEQIVRCVSVEVVSDSQSDSTVCSNCWDHLGIVTLDSYQRSRMLTSRGLNGTR